MASIENTKSASEDWLLIFKVINCGLLQSSFISYPFYLQQEGGGIYFLVNILVSLIVISVLFIIELCVGKLNQSDLINVWGNMVPLLRGIGYSSTIVSFYILGSTGLICAMSGYYFVNSFQSPPPWSNYSSSLNATNNSCTNLRSSGESYYKQVVFPTVIDLEEDLSPPHLHLLICLLVVFFSLCFIQLICLMEQYTWILPIVSSTLCLTPCILILILFFGAIVNGATPVFPEWRIKSLSILFNSRIWINVLLRSFNYLPLGIGAGIRLGSLANLNSNFCKTVIYLGLIGVATEMAVGTLLNTAIHQLAAISGVNPESFYTVGHGIVFHTFSCYLLTLEIGSKFQTVLYFLLMLTISVSPVLTLIQRLSVLFKEMFPAISNVLVTCIVGGMGIILAVPALTPHGNVYFLVIELYGIRPVKIFLVLMQLVAICIYKPKKFCRGVEFVVRKRVCGFFKLICLLVLPLSVVVLLWEVWKTTNYFTYKGIPMPNWALASGSTMLGLVALAFFLPGIYEFVNILKTSNSMYEVIKKCLKSNTKFGPVDDDDRQSWIELQEYAKWREKTKNSRLMFSEWV